MDTKGSEEDPKRGRFRIFRSGKVLQSSETTHEISRKVKKEDAKIGLTSRSEKATSAGGAGASSNEIVKRKGKGVKKSKAGKENNAPKTVSHGSSAMGTGDEAEGMISKNEEGEKGMKQEGFGFDSTQKPSGGDNFKRPMKVPACAKVSNRVRQAGTVNPQLMKLVSEHQSHDSELFYDRRGHGKKVVQTLSQKASDALFSAAKRASEDKWREVVKDQLSPTYAPINSLVSFDSNSTRRKSVGEHAEKLGSGCAVSADVTQESKRKE